MNAGSAAPPPRPPYGWIAVLGVLSGAPYGLVNEALPVVWAAAHVETARITVLVADASLPWTLKFLWAPFVDRFFPRRAWILAGGALIAGLLLLLSTRAPSDGGAAVGWILVGIAVASATQDVAIDGYAVEALPERSYGTGNGIRVTAYRAGLLLFGGVLAARAVGLGTGVAWPIAAGVVGLASLSALALPSAVRTRTVLDAPSLFVEPFRRLVSTPGFVGILAFVLLFKACDYAMPSSLTKAYLVKAGISASVIGDVLTPIGIGATVGGAVLGGLVTTRIGIFRALWILGLLQAGSNLVYAGAAWSGSKPVLFGAAVIEPFCSGLGTAPFLAFLMACCDRRHAATHFALWSAAMALGRWFFTRWSGAGAEAIGYAPWFALTFLVALPAYLLLPLVRRRLAPPPAPASDRGLTPFGRHRPGGV